MLKKLRKRMKRAVKRLRKSGGGSSWEKTPSAWLVFFVAITALPVGCAVWLSGYLYYNLVPLTHQHGLDPVGIALWLFAFVITGYAWQGRMIMKRCNGLLLERWYPL